MLSIVNMRLSCSPVPSCANFRTTTDSLSTSHDDYNGMIFMLCFFACEGNIVCESKYFGASNAVVFMTSVPETKKGRAFCLSIILSSIKNRSSQKVIQIWGTFIALSNEL
jgi:hypothetical protein